MSFGLENTHLPRNEIAARIDEAARMLEIAPLLDRRPGQLSGGQRQRVAIGRAIVREPAAFLLDEPLSNLDAELRVSMRAELAALHARLGTTMIYVTHDQVEAMTLASRIVVLRAGRIEQVDTPLGLFNRPANRFVAGFIGAPGMNFLPAGLVHTRHQPPGRDLTVGIRPQHLRLAVRRRRRHDRRRPSPWSKPSAPRPWSMAPRREGQTILAVLQGQARLDRGQSIALACDLADLHFFAADGRRIG